MAILPMETNLMHTLFRKILFVALSAFSVLLISCGGGSGGGSDIASTGGSAADTGTVTLLVTDAPTDRFKEINLSIIRAELLSDDGNKELFRGKKKFDLLQLTNVTEIFSVSEVPSGTYNKIRLTLTQIELVFNDSSIPAYPKLTGNGKLDLNPREDFYVDCSNPLTIQLDFDAGKSIHVKHKEKYNFRPVVFIKIIKDKFDTKLVRQRGTVENLDGRTEEFDLCLIEAEVQPVSIEKKHDFPDCVRVNTTDAPASIFDDNADPISFRELENGDIATVVGRFSFNHYTVTPRSDDSSSDD
ncbi:MAG: DUF4382 domain-containing protein, partial [Gammaproteobacteria bacterium]|nr:DUF4382 domain-containing protein [Gammaproteobacteria bacterium]